MRLWLRADGSALIGLGHVMRLLALAERARDEQLEPRFIVGGEPTAQSVVEARGFTATFVTDSDEHWLDHVAAHDAVVFDGYHFRGDLLERARIRAAHVGAVDDFAGGAFPVDVLLNQNLVTDPAYVLPAGGRLLIGPRYALIRREFLTYRRDRGDDPPRTLLLTMGAADVASLTQRAVEVAAARDCFDRVLVVVGPSAGRLIPRLAPDIDLVQAPANVAETFASADAAIAVAGSTTWELLAIGLPTALVQVVDNQSHIGPGVAREGAGLFLGGADQLADRFVDATRELADPVRRRRLSARALELVDGRGADRFLSALLGSRVSHR